MARFGITTMLAVVLVSTIASAQEQRAGESIEVAIVNVEVHVTDRQGNLVLGLNPEDFEIRESGKLQPVTNFSEFRSAANAGTASVEAAPPGAQDAAVAPMRARRSIVIFIEPLSLAHFRAEQFFDSIRSLLRRTVGKGDQVAIVTFVRAMRMRQPFTDDMAALETALAALQKEMTGVEGHRYDEYKYIVNESATFEKEYEEALQELGVDASNMTAAVSLSALAAARRELFLIRQKTAALESLMHGISGADGRKIVIMATRRYGLYAGAEYFEGGVPNVSRQELDTAVYRRSLIRTANAHGITIYALHPEGMQDTRVEGSWKSGNDLMESTLEQDLTRMNRDNAGLMNEASALDEVAVATGGASAVSTVSIARLLPRVGDDLETYYSLGYRATTTGKDDARRIVVTTKNPQHVVRARKQFVEKSETTQLKDRVRANLYQRVEGSSAKIPFDVAVGAFKKTGRNRWTVPVKIRIPIKSLTVMPRGVDEAGSFSVFFATGGVLGVMSEVEQRTQSFTIPSSELSKAKQSYFTYDLELQLDKLVQTISIAVLDDVGKEFGIKRFELPREARK
jgi:VWFA-related protein